jgi:hypothetical protein
MLSKLKVEVKSRKKPVRLTDAQIRDHLEATSFHGLYVSQANIDQVRGFMEAEARRKRRAAKTQPTLIYGPGE